ncbi:hypothetical protein L596_005214 [Steinernema carpocapsae]|uniref:LIM zinc-binding domain-containing protein n=1 Tax=Steinernema carpocapsae TaxID=34508 RepID=A0A4U8UY86_STECR|nr:hypothetical protein L596_005214 [Steinernema carpocapsae]
MFETASIHRSPLVEGPAKPIHVLGHDIGAGSRLELHFWRKMCKRCYCRMDEHDITLPNLKNNNFVGRLFDDDISSCTSFEGMRSVTEDMNSMCGALKDSRISDQRRYSSHSSCTLESQSTHGPTLPPQTANGESGQFGQAAPAVPQQATVRETHKSEYSWAPTNNPELANKYFSSLPPEERPLVGSEGDRTRRQRLAYQLPYHDCDTAAAISIKSDADRNLHSKFVDKVKQESVGIGHVIEVNKNTQTEPERIIHAPGPCQWPTCENHLKTGDVGVTTDHGSSQNVWHPNCFRCATCEQLLVDLLYFFQDNKYYCGRHYAEKIYPRCFGCDELIFAKEYTFAEDKSWHYEHFSCFGCDTHLGGYRYLVKNDHPYCNTCYMNKFAKAPSAQKPQNVNAQA